MTKLSVATTKRYKDGAGAWQEKTQWHDCVAYGPTGDYAAKILKGAHVMLEGELAHREYERTIETDNGPVKVPWPVTEVVIDSVSVLDRKREREERGDGERRSVASRVSVAIGRARGKPASAIATVDDPMHITDNDVLF